MSKYLLTINALWVWGISAMLFCSTLHAAALSVVTEEAISLQYKSAKTNKMEGPAAVLVEKVIKTAGIEFSTKVLPWARAYKEAEHTKDTLIYSILRTPEREDKFHWLGVIAKPQYYLFALKDAKFTQANDVNTFKNYRIATLSDSANHQLLESNGFTHLITLNDAKNVFELLKRKRVDFITANKRTFKTICEFNGEKCDNIVAIAPIKMPASSLLYFAINKASDPKLVKRLKDSYKTLISKGEIAVF